MSPSNPSSKKYIQCSFSSSIFYILIVSSNFWSAGVENTNYIFLILNQSHGVSGIKDKEEITKIS